MATDQTKSCLIATAEALFADNGIDAVTLRGINRASGVKNAVAVQYHFGDRDGVLQAILDKHRPEVEARRHAMLDEYDASGGPGIRQLASALVRPLAAKLSDPDGGPAFLGIYAELMSRPKPPVEPLPVSEGSSIQRWRRAAQQLRTAEQIPPGRGFQALRFAAAELGRRAAAGPGRNDSLFVSQLIDLVAAMLTAPQSEETTRLTGIAPPLSTKRGRARGRD